MKPQRGGRVRCSAWLGIVFLFGGLNNNLAEIPKLRHPAGSFVSTQSRCGYDVHELGALKNERLERRNLLKLSGGVGKLLGQLGTTLKLRERNLQSKLTEMLPLLKAGSAGSGGQSAPNTNRSSNQGSAGSDGGDKNNLTHIFVAGVVGCISVVCGYLIGVWITVRLTMPNDPSSATRPEGDSI